MYIQGKIIKIMDTLSGEGAKGPWKKKEFIMETNAKVPRQVCLTIRGEGVDLFQYRVGDVIQANIDLESREYNSKWYTEVRAWKLTTDLRQRNGDSNQSTEDEY
jgi:hypothetical protein